MLEGGESTKYTAAYHTRVGKGDTGWGHALARICHRRTAPHQQSYNFSHKHVKRSRNTPNITRAISVVKNNITMSRVLNNWQCDQL